MNVIVFDGISKAYRQTASSSRIEALSGLSLKIQTGEVFAMAGLNGAGKTTAMKILLGLCRPDSGSVSLLSGVSSADGGLVATGYAPEEPDLPAFLTVDELLRASCELSGTKPASALLDRAVQMLSLSDERHRIVEQLSKGTRQRVSLAAAIVHRPELVILDEPASGLDPLGRHLVKNVIRQLNSEGATVFFTTHILSDLPGLCSRIGVLHHGKLAFVGTPAEFCGSETMPALEERFAALVGGNETMGAL